MIANRMMRAVLRMRIIRLRSFWGHQWFYLLLIIATCFGLSVLRTHLFGYMPRLLYTVGGVHDASRIYTEILGYNCRSVHTDPELELPCRTNFSTNLKENIRKIMNYPSAHVKEYFHRENLDVFRQRDLSGVVPVFATAISSNHYDELMGGLNSFHNTVLQFYPDLRLILYDIGLSEEEIVKKMLMEFGAVFWMDASLRFNRNNISDVFAHAQKYGIAIWDSGFDNPSPSLIDPRMFKFFNEERCLFRSVGMVEANAIVLYNTNITFHAILKPWLACAMAKHCIAPDGSSFFGCRPPDGATYRCCHRQDEAALTIVVNRVYQYGLKRDVYAPRPAVSLERLTPSLLQLDQIIRTWWKTNTYS